jgi:hypothetical protein
MFCTAAISFLSLVVNSSAQTNQTQTNKAPVVVTNTTSLSSPVRSVPTHTNRAQNNLPPVVAVNVTGTNPATQRKGERSDIWLGLFGVILGACLAYAGDALKERRKTHNEQHKAILRSQLALIGHLNTLTIIKKDYLDPARESHEREKQLIRYRMEDTNWRVPYDSIAFLLITKNPNIVLAVHSAEQTYISAMHALEARNQAYEQLHASSKLEGMDPNTGQCILTADRRHIHLLKLTTDSLYTTVDTAIGRLTTEIKELYDTGKFLYPDRSYPLRLFYPKRGFLKPDGQKE